MDQWAAQAGWQTKHLDGDVLIEAIAGSHIEFERIHPFSDGNGRTGRMILAFQTISRFGVPAIIVPEDRAEYIDMLDSEDVPALRDKLTNTIAAETERRREFEPGHTRDHPAGEQGGAR